MIWAEIKNWHLTGWATQVPQGCTVFNSEAHLCMWCVNVCLPVHMPHQIGLHGTMLWAYPHLPNCRGSCHPGAGCKGRVFLLPGSAPRFSPSWLCVVWYLTCDVHFCVRCWSGGPEPQDRGAQYCRLLPTLLSVEFLNNGAPIVLKVLYFIQICAWLELQGRWSHWWLSSNQLGPMSTGLLCSCDKPLPLSPALTHESLKEDMISGNGVLVSCGYYNRLPEIW